MRKHEAMLGVLSLAVVCAGCASAGGGPQAVAVGARPAVTCDPETALPAALREAGGIVLFGEIHGARELPRFFGEAVCTAASSGLPVEVGVEMPAGERDTIDRFLASAGGPEDVEALLATPFWNEAYQDGRRSEAMLALLQRVRDLRAQGLPLQLFPFDVDAFESAGARDAAMATTIAARAKAHPGAITMVLVGEVHAWKAKGTPWDPEFLPMGWHLVEAGMQPWSLGRSSSGGEVWACWGGQPGDCKPGRAGASPTLPSGRTHGIELLSEPTKRGNDGLFAVPSLSVSPPARDAKG